MIHSVVHVLVRLFSLPIEGIQNIPIPSIETRTGKTVPRFFAQFTI